MSIKNDNLRKALLLYLVTDRHWLNGEDLNQQVKEAIKGGVTMVQLREKNLSDDSFLKEALSMIKVTKALDIPLIINDNIKVAKECGADGVHIGQSDGNVADARKLLGENAIIGVSAHTPELAKKAEQEGADYIGAGAVFPTGSKDDAETISPDILRDICSAVSIPVVAIGGITKSNVHLLSDTGCAGIAVISAILAQDDKQKAASDLKIVAEEALGER